MSDLETKINSGKSSYRDSIIDAAKQKCDGCGSKELIKDNHSELVCNKCGLVQENLVLDAAPPAGSGSEDGEKKVHWGPSSSINRHDKNLPTYIMGNKDAHGKSISLKNKQLMYRMKKWQARIRVSNNLERSLSQGLSLFDARAGQMGLPGDIRKHVAYLYKKVLEASMLRGRSSESMLAATTYAACREMALPRTLDEIASYFTVKKRDVGRDYRFMKRELHLSIGLQSPHLYLPKMCAELGLGIETQQKAKEILEEAKSSRGPLSQVSGAVYMASIIKNERRTQREVADAAGVTEVTVRNAYKEMAEKLNLQHIQCL